MRTAWSSYFIHIDLPASNWQPTFEFAWKTLQTRTAAQILMQREAFY
jgi:hypothetical protein